MVQTSLILRPSEVETWRGIYTPSAHQDLDSLTKPFDNGGLPKDLVQEAFMYGFLRASGQQIQAHALNGEVVDRGVQQKASAPYLFGANGGITSLSDANCESYIRPGYNGAIDETLLNCGFESPMWVPMCGFRTYTNPDVHRFALALRAIKDERIPTTPRDERLPEITIGGMIFIPGDRNTKIFVDI
ncbi:hypothetical protein HYV86_02690 [Candidatus Woesearchaeota archaeon]|nr:hypothetical protein [Candidatus Woesearchaeota archaeon]